MSSVISAMQDSMERYEREAITDEELRVEILNALHGGIDRIQDKQEKEYVFGILGLLLDKGLVEPKVVQDIRDYLVPPAEQDISMKVPSGKVRVRTALREKKPGTWPRITLFTTWELFSSSCCVRLCFKG